MEQFKYLSKIFVVIDPTQMYQPALEKAEFIAKAYDHNIHLYCCVHDPLGDGNSETATETREQVVARTERWLKRLITGSHNFGIDASFEVEWNSDWIQAAADAAKRYQAQMLVKTTYRHSAMRRALLRSSDAILMRKMPCPALLVKTGTPYRQENRKLLLALKAQPKDETYDLLNEWIIEAGHSIAEKGNFDIHVGHAYSVEGMYYDRRALAKSCGLPLDHVHDSADQPHTGLIKIAKDIQPDLVLIGTRQDATGLRLGDTAERVLDGLPMDVLVMPVSGFSFS